MPQKKPAKPARAAQKPRAVRLADYRPPPFCVDSSDLEFDLGVERTTISARHRIRRAAPGGVTLHAENMRITRVTIDADPLPPSRWRHAAGQLTIPSAPAEFTLGVENTIHPNRNTALSGLYHSRGILCTQCEAEGFRRITPALDRPDNLSRYTVTLRADKKSMPVLLCNGNMIERGDCDGGRHFAKWHDPFPKPSYLFAVVAGDLARIEDRFTTASGREVLLYIYAAKRDIGKCAYAMESLKRAFAWDEKTYGREYDLSVFNVVAVDDFNMGAMENKSLNIFNAQYILAERALSADSDFENVEAVVAHEYFHNWSGNRVTCRDWFQLSLKEGFTVFREQQFCADTLSGAVKRIDDAFDLRNHQFREDAGPMAHAVRPQSYVEINNFYTATVYHKGAEVIRMLHTLLGAEVFRRGADLYFARHDGGAATTDDFVAAMENAAGADLTQFKNWYAQAGTPLVKVSTAYDARRGALTISLAQTCRATPGQARKKPFVIPLRAALFTQTGECMRTRDGGAEKLLVLSEAKQKFIFHGVTEKPVLSLLRGFSAPVELRFEMSERELAVLLAHDDDAFCRWEAGQKLFMRRILASLENRAPPEPPAELFGGVERVLDTALADAALAAKLIELPGQDYIAAQLEMADPAAVFHARRELKRALCNAFREKFASLYARCNAMQDGAINAKQIALRALRNACLHFLLAADDAESHAIAEQLFANARCMTDKVAALAALAHSTCARRGDALDAFYARYQNEPLLVNKWLRIQACAPHADTAKRVQALTRHPAFDRTNPNKIYALLLAFCHANPLCFHARDGSGYRLAGKWTAALDKRNPQVAARLASAFTNWKKYPRPLQTKMRAELRALAKLPKLSRDTGEIVTRSLRG